MNIGGMTGKDIGVAIVIAVIAGAVFAGVLSAEFVNYDDPLYVTNNSMVGSGLTVESVEWAFTTGHTGNWHPLTWLSHMLDVELFGFGPRGHHAVNVLIHALNAALMFVVLRLMTGAMAPSAVVALVFAVHPLHVESVAWVAERKDVLSGFFWLAAMLAYWWYAIRPGVFRYCTVVLLFGCGLMAKPMVVTLPFVLLLIDWWPLGRIRGFTPLSAALPRRHGKLPQLSPARIVIEKLPLVALSTISAAVTFIVQAGSGSVATLGGYPVTIRLMNAVVSYVRYIGKTLSPGHLAVIYPFNAERLTIPKTVGALLVIAVITAAVARQGKKRPYLPVGWFWYLGTLVPVIGIVQVGSQSFADRYTYLPLTGLFIAAGWGLFDWAGRNTVRQRISAAAVSILCVLLTVMTVRQTRYWHDSGTLFAYALRVTENNAMAHNNLASYYIDNGRFDDARPHLERAVRLQPQFTEARVNLGVVLIAAGEYPRAVETLEKAVESAPSFPRAWYNLGRAHERLTEYPLAETAYVRAVALDPSSAESHARLGLVRIAEGRFDGAVEALSRAVELDRNRTDVWNNLGVAYYRQGNSRGALIAFTTAADIDPSFADALANRAWVLATAPGEDIRDSESALEAVNDLKTVIGEENARYLQLRAAALGASGRFEEAGDYAEKATVYARATGDSAMVDELRRQILDYRENRPFIDDPSAK